MLCAVERRYPWRNGCAGTRKPKTPNPAEVLRSLKGAAAKKKKKHDNSSGVLAQLGTARVLENLHAAGGGKDTERGLPGPLQVRAAHSCTKAMSNDGVTVNTGEAMDSIQ